MAHDPHSHGTDAPHATHDVDAVPTLFVVYLAVLALAVANIFLWTTGLGAISLPVQMGIACVQAALVAWYWMHVRHGDTAVSMSIATTLFFMGIFFLLVFADLLTRHYAAL